MTKRAALTMIADTNINAMPLAEVRPSSNEILLVPDALLMNSIGLIRVFEPLAPFLWSGPSFSEKIFHPENNRRNCTCGLAVG
jgi:hypothetical protein